MSDAPKPIYVFGPFRLDGHRRILQRGPELVPLPPKAVDLLIALVESQGTVATKDELLQRVWPDTFVEESNLSVQVFTLRKALGDPGEAFIRTVPKRGYSFVCPVSLEPEGRLPRPDAPIASTSIAPVPAPGGPDPAPRRRWLWVAGLTIVTAALASLSYVGTTRVGRVVVPGQLQALAVLPWVTTGIGPGHEHLGAGVASDVIERMAALPRLTTRPLASTLKFSGTGADRREAGRTLQVDTVVQGTLSLAGDRFSLDASLVRVADGERLWTGSWSEPTDALADVVTTLTVAIARTLEPDLQPADEARLTRVAPRPAAYRNYLEARGLAHQMTAREVTAAMPYFEEAVRLDEGFAEAHAGLASFLVHPLNLTPMADNIGRARTAAERALALAPDNAEAHAALGRVLNLGDWNWPGAADEYRRAMVLAPRAPEPHFWYGVHLSAQGRHDEAVSEMRLTQALDPTSPRFNYQLGLTLLMARRYDEAVAQFRRTPLEMGPTGQLLYLGTAVALREQGLIDQALSVVDRIRAGTGGTPQSRAHRAWILAASGRAGEAAPLLTRFGPDAGDWPAPSLLGAAHACAGDFDQAFLWIDEALRRKDVRVAYLKVDPIFDCVRRDVRYADRLRRIGLAP